jgi:cytochrome c oxidase assembly protein subunit 11
MTETAPSARRLRRTAFACLGLVAGMGGLAYASVPLYDLFCRLTGFDGTPVVSTTGPARTGERTVTVRLDSNVAPGLPWRFGAETAEVEVKVGETATVFYRVLNAGSAASTGIATFNVQPSLAAAYFVKMECFCFKEQTLAPGETMDSAVVFYVDPAIADDPNLRDLRSLTLSYTYFPAKGAATAAVAVRPNP